MDGLYPDGAPLDHVFTDTTGVSFKDIIIMDRVCDREIDDVSLKAKLTREIELNLPIVSSPMDTVTESRLATHMALLGGIGIIHFNCTPKRQAEEVERVKRSRMGLITRPLCLRADQPIGRIKEIKKAHGFSTVLVTEDGTSETKLIGMVTQDRVLIVRENQRTLKDVMIPASQLQPLALSALPDGGNTLEFLRSYFLLSALPDGGNMLDFLRSYFLERPNVQKLPILRDDGSVHGLVTRRGLAQPDEYPNLVCGSNQELLVGAAVSTQDSDLDRAHLLADAGADVIVIDSAQGASRHAAARIKEIVTGIKSRRPGMQIIAGNVTTKAQAEYLISLDVDGLRVGGGSGGGCKTSDVIGTGRDQLSAVFHVSRAAKRRGIPVISDGGIEQSGDMVKAISCGAKTVMVGKYLAGTDEACSKFTDDRRFKIYRGMASSAAIREGGIKRYGEDFDPERRDYVTEGVEVPVPAIGPVDVRLEIDRKAIVRFLKDHVNCASLTELHDAVSDRKVMFERLSDGARLGRTDRR